MRILISFLGLLLLTACSHELMSCSSCPSSDEQATVDDGPFVFERPIAEADLPPIDIDRSDDDEQIDAEQIDADPVDPDADLIPSENMMLIEGATFMMGCEIGVAPNCTQTNSLPQHEVTVSGFEIDVYEITKKEYEACIAAGGCENDIDNDLLLYQTNTDLPFCVLNSAYDDLYPVNCVSWYGARAYCAWAGKRLPSEAEWELAARGTDGRYYPWGNTPAPSCDNTVMYGENDWGCDQGLSLPVGSKAEGASPYGLYDMAGNMWEWVEDDWHDSYDDPSRPDDGSAWVDAERSENRVIRGASFMTAADESYEFLTYGHFGSPAGDPFISRGFRCAR